MADGMANTKALGRVVPGQSQRIVLCVPSRSCLPERTGTQAESFGRRNGWGRPANGTGAFHLTTTLRSAPCSPHRRDTETGLGPSPCPQITQRGIGRAGPPTVKSEFFSGFHNENISKRPSPGPNSQSKALTSWNSQAGVISITACKAAVMYTPGNSLSKTMWPTFALDIARLWVLMP